MVQIVERIVDLGQTFGALEPRIRENSLDRAELRFVFTEAIDQWLNRQRLCQAEAGVYCSADDIRQRCDSSDLKRAEFRRERGNLTLRLRCIEFVEVAANVSKTRRGSLKFEGLVESLKQ